MNEAAPQTMNEAAMQNEDQGHTETTQSGVAAAPFQLELSPEETAILDDINFRRGAQSSTIKETMHHLITVSTELEVGARKMERQWWNDTAKKYDLNLQKYLYAVAEINGKRYIVIDSEMQE